MADAATVLTADQQIAIHAITKGQYIGLHLHFVGRKDAEFVWMTFDGVKYLLDKNGKILKRSDQPDRNPRGEKRPKELKCPACETMNPISPTATYVTCRNPKCKAPLMRVRIKS